MAITSSAKRAIRTAKRRHVYNVRRTEAMRGTVKEIRTMVINKKTTDAEKMLPEAFKAIDKAAKRGVIKKNTAARKKSRLVKLIRKNAK